MVNSTSNKVYFEENTIDDSFEKKSLRKNSSRCSEQEVKIIGVDNLEVISTSMKRAMTKRLIMPNNVTKSSEAKILNGNSFQ